MKKVLAILSIMLVFCGCTFGKEMTNTPTKRVEALFSKYQTLDSDVLDSLDNVIDEDTKFNTEQRQIYRDIMKKHYQDMTYDIKKEKIDGDKATVEAEVEVMDYTKVLADAENYKTKHADEFLNNKKEFDASKYMDYRLKELKKATEKTKYTLEFTLTKKDGQWELDKMTKENEQKIHGMYTK